MPGPLEAERDRSARRRRNVAGWLAGWCVLALAVGWLLVDVRSRVLNEAKQPQTTKDWQDWKAAVERGEASLGPVARRPLKSDEPPAVVLMRDHFPALAIGCGVFLSLTYLFFAIAVTGMFASHSAGPKRAAS
jgi:hypothetical protein